MAKYPDINVPLTEINGNAFSILGHVMKAMRRNDVPEKEIEEYRKAATSGDYDNLIQVTTEWVGVS